MSEAIKMMLIQTFMSTLLSLLDEKTLKKALDTLFDVIEDAVQNSETEIDDTIVLPLVAKLRLTLDVPDYPDAPKA